MLDLHHLPGSTLEEHRIHTMRAHWITLVPIFLAGLLVFVLPPLAYEGFLLYRPDIFDDPTHFTLFVLGASIFFLFGLLFVFQTFIDYWLDVFIVTDKRILDIEQKGLFHRTVSELRLYRVQDVTAEVKGFLHTIFDYGDIYIQTAGERERFEFIDVAHPNQMAKTVLELAEEDRKEHLEETVEEFGMPDYDGDNAKKAAARKLEP